MSETFRANGYKFRPGFEAFPAQTGVVPPDRPAKLLREGLYLKDCQPLFDLDRERQGKA